MPANFLIFIYNRNFYLLFYIQPSFAQFNNKSVFIERLKKSGTESTVYFNCRANNLFCQFLIFQWAH